MQPFEYCSVRAGLAVTSLCIVFSCSKALALDSSLSLRLSHLAWSQIRTRTFNGEYVLIAVESAKRIIIILEHTFFYRMNVYEH